MKILVLSDTHIPKAAQDLPPEIYDAIKGVDMILHAGDFADRDTYDRLASLKEMKAVAGNMDSIGVRSILNPKEVVRVGKFRIGIIHGYGAPNELMKTVQKEFEKVDAIVFGHSHKPVNVVKDGVLFFNPGSPTDTIFAEFNSYGIIEVTDKKIEGKIIRL
jgi:putative phosphoesterase